MCLARRMNFSRKTSGTPNAVCGLAPGLLDRGVELVGRLDDAHAAAAAAHRRLDDHGIAERLGQLARLGARLDRLVARRQDRHAGLVGHLPGGDLVAELVEQLGPRADEGDAGRVAGPRELGVLGEEAVAGMDRVDLLLAAPARRSPRCPGSSGSARPALPTW